MTKARLEAFSDGVIAILITIMVLELHVPHEATWSALRPAGAGLSHLRPQLRVPRHLLEQPSPHAARRRPHQRQGAVGESAPAVLAVADSVRHRLDGTEPLRAHPHRRLRHRPDVRGHCVLHPGAHARRRAGPDSRLARAIGRDCKGKMSVVLYAIGIGLAFVNQWMSDAIYVGVALMWLVPDRRIEKHAHAAST